MVVRWKASIRPSADLPTTNMPPQMTAVVVANAMPAVGLLMALLPCDTSIALEGRNATVTAFISTMIEKTEERYLEMPAREELRLSAVLEALADPVRLETV